MRLKLSCGRELLFSEFPENPPVRLRPVLDSVKKNHPKRHASWCDGSGQLRGSLPVFINGTHIRYKNGLDSELDDGDEVYIIPIVTGG